MRYFSRGWANGELTDDQDNAVRTAYRTRLVEIDSRLPTAIRQLLEGASLHDALIESVRWRPSARELRLTLVGGSFETGYHSIYLTYRGAMLGSSRIDSLRNAASNREACILYQEVDVEVDGTLAHRLLFWPNDEVTIECAEFEYLSEPRDDCRVTLGGAFVIETDEPDGTA